MKGIKKELIENKLDMALECIANNFHRSISMTNDIERYLLPGAKKLLIRLVDLGYVISLMTGSTSKVAKEILKLTGLDKFFNTLTFGEEAKNRDGLFQISIKKIEKKFGREFRGKAIVMIGDSIRDIECGKKFSALTIAVATGHHSQEDLKKHNPDHILDSLEDYDNIIEIISKDRQ